MFRAVHLRLTSSCVVAAASSIGGLGLGGRGSTGDWRPDRKSTGGPSIASHRKPKTVVLAENERGGDGYGTGRTEWKRGDKKKRRNTTDEEKKEKCHPSGQIDPAATSCSVTLRPLHTLEASPPPCPWCSQSFHFRRPARPK